MTPTIAEVREALLIARAGLQGHRVDERPRAEYVMESVFPVVDDAIARLDPDSMAIVTRDSLAAAMWTADEAMVDEPLGDRGYHDAMADLIFDALREAER